jgi:hypothetical protein
MTGVNKAVDKLTKEDTRLAMRRGPGADMLRYEKDSPAPGAKKHRDDTAKAAKAFRSAGGKMDDGDEVGRDAMGQPSRNEKGNAALGDKQLTRYNRDHYVKEGTGKCNESAKGKSCPVHGLKECGSMSESKVEEYHDPIYYLNVMKANKKSGQLKMTYWLRQEAGLSQDAHVYFDDADLVYGEKTIVPDALVNPKLKIGDLLVALEKAIQEKETEGGDMYEASKPSAGMSKGAKSALVKKATAGKDIGKPGKSFDKVAAKAGGGEKGKKIAAAAMWKNAAKESVELKPVVVAESAEMARLKELTKILNG